MKFRILIEVEQSSIEAVRATARLVGDNVQVLQVIELGLPPKAGYVICTQCHGRWDGERMSCMFCDKGYIPTR